MRKVSYMLAVLLVCSLVARAADEVNLIKAPEKADSWRLEQHEGGKGKMSADAGALLFDVTDVDGEAWHVQATTSGLTLAEGKEYTLSFQAKADKDRQIGVQAMIDEDDWHPIGLTEQVDLTKEFKPVTFTFKAENVAKNNKNRITLQFGQEKGKVWVKDVKLVAK